MRSVWWVLLFVVGGLSGCLGADEVGEDTPMAVPPVEKGDGEKGNTSAGTPPGPEREDEVWAGAYPCVAPPGLPCPAQWHEFEAEAGYEELVLTVMMTAPGLVSTNGLGFVLQSPEGFEERGRFSNGVFVGGESVQVRFDATDARAGTWRAGIPGPPDVSFIAVMYDAQVSFRPLGGSAAA